MAIVDGPDGPFDTENSITVLMEIRCGERSIYLRHDVPRMAIPSLEDMFAAGHQAVKAFEKAHGARPDPGHARQRGRDGEAPA